MESQEIKQGTIKRKTKIDWLKEILESNHDDLKGRIDKLIEEFKNLQDIDEIDKQISRLQAKKKRKNDKIKLLRSDK